MFVGDLLQGVAAFIGAIALFLTVDAFANFELGLGIALIGVAASVAYAAEVHGGAPLVPSPETGDESEVTDA